jgi:hypothetical protein
MIRRSGLRRGFGVTVVQLDVSAVVVQLDASVNREGPSRASTPRPTIACRVRFTRASGGRQVRSRSPVTAAGPSRPEATAAGSPAGPSTPAR